MPRPKREKRPGDRTSGRRKAKEEGRGGEDDGHSTFMEWIRSGAVALVLFFILRTFLVQTFVITSGSMEDTLLVGDFLMVNRAALGSQIPFTDVRVPGYSEPRRFDVLVFDPPHEEDLKLVKRLVGMPGDTLAMRDKILFINGEPVEEPWVRYREDRDQRDPWMGWQRQHLLEGVDPGDYEPSRDNWGPLVIPEEHYFMLGDNRDTSLDSRYWGLLEAWRLEGRAVFIYFSYDRGSLKPLPALTAPRLGRVGRIIR